MTEKTQIVEQFSNSTSIALPSDLCSINDNITLVPSLNKTFITSELNESYNLLTKIEENNDKSNNCEINSQSPSLLNNNETNDQIQNDKNEIKQDCNLNINVNSLEKIKDEEIEDLRILKFKEPIQSIYPWEYASVFPETVIKGTEVRIYPFPNDITKEEIYENFNIIGDIIDIKIYPLNKENELVDENSHKTQAEQSDEKYKYDDKSNFCECLVRFKTLDVIDKIFKLSNAKFDGQLLKIEKTKEDCTIFIGNLKKKWRENHVNDLFRNKVKAITEIKFLVDPNFPDKNRGYCFLKFDNPQFAKMAYESLSKNLFIDGQLLSLDWADEYDSDKDLNKTQIHISGITSIIKSEELYNVFLQYGHIVQMKLSRDFENKSRTDYGFITYSSEKEALAAMNEFNYKDYFPEPLKLQYARKIAAIVNHRRRTDGENKKNILQKKRKRSNLSEDNPKNNRSNNFDYNQVRLSRNNLNDKRKNDLKKKMHNNININEKSGINERNSEVKHRNFDNEKILRKHSNYDTIDNNFIDYNINSMITTAKNNFNTNTGNQFIKPINDNFQLMNNNKFNNSGLANNIIKTSSEFNLHKNNSNMNDFQNNLIHQLNPTYNTLNSNIPNIYQMQNAQNNVNLFNHPNQNIHTNQYSNNNIAFNKNPNNKIHNNQFNITNPDYNKVGMQNFATNANNYISPQSISNIKPDLRLISNNQNNTNFVSQYPTHHQNNTLFNNSISNTYRMPPNPQNLNLSNSNNKSATQIPIQNFFDTSSSFISNLPNNNMINHNYNNNNSNFKFNKNNSNQLISNMYDNKSFEINLQNQSPNIISNNSNPYLNNNINKNNNNLFTYNNDANLYSNFIPNSNNTNNPPNFNGNYYNM